MNILFAAVGQAGHCFPLVPLAQELRDAGLIASAQRVEHYEIAVYGSLATWAKQLGLDEDLPALLDILEEEKRTDESMSTLAKRVVNPDAAAT